MTISCNAFRIDGEDIFSFSKLFVLLYLCDFKAMTPKARVFCVVLNSLRSLDSNF